MRFGAVFSAFGQLVLIAAPPASPDLGSRQPFAAIFLIFGAVVSGWAVDPRTPIEDLPAKGSGALPSLFPMGQLTTGVGNSLSEVAFYAFAIP